MYQLSRLIFGKATSLAPSMSRQDEVAEDRRHRRDQHEEHHDHAVHGEHLVVGVAREEIAGGRRQLEADAASRTDRPGRRPASRRCRYMMPMRLWSFVRSHDATLCSWFRYVSGVDAMVLFVLRGCRCRGARFGGRARLTATGGPQRLHVLDEGDHASLRSAAPGRSASAAETRRRPWPAASEWIRERTLHRP